MPTRPRLTSTHTVATLEVSPQTYDEIAGKLRDAEYHHCFEDDKPGAMIDMSGIGITRVATLICKTCVQEYPLDKPHVCPGLQTPEERDVAEMLAYLTYAMTEKKAGGVYGVTFGFKTLEASTAFHAWAAARAAKAGKS
jgi:hypothetical protein